MTGLLKKDLFVLKSQRVSVTIGLFMVLALVMGNEEPILGVFAIAFLSATLGVSTIAYDEFNNSNAFLFTLPITRSLYTVEKYVFSFIFTTVISLFSSVLLFLLYRQRVLAYGLSLWLLLIVGSIFVSLIIPALLIPINLKFGSEKGRMVMIILFVFIGVLSPNISKIIPKKSLVTFINFISGLSPIQLLLLVIVIILGFSTISALISKQIMAKKEF
ncbi:ABC-2 transporter permease [Vagococcus elongatus]|uniref:ABC-2 transporter permease n=1 Tax=Vagococcus elongatus TaxID=180344 RepID=A0A430B1U0_9ENTE|nr:ABC-2 transporter permease [Vagococcus elongatus]RSU14307.1 hypothetical protein CBF29_03120 [Vagococcus elongatus]